ncbi:MAG: hypothetical protein OEM52_07480 [bacterium]|nr:hypothetical protein [bacterium]
MALSATLLKELIGQQYDSLDADGSSLASLIEQHIRQELGSVPAFAGGSYLDPIPKMSRAIAQAVHQNTKTIFAGAVATAMVQHFVSAGVVTVAAGIAVSTAGSPAAQTGATTAPGVGVIS